MLRNHLAIAVGLGSLLVLAPASRAEELPPGVTPEWVRSVTRSLEAREYGFAGAPDGSASAGNHAHALEARVAAHGVAVAPRSGPAEASLDLRLARLGREGDLADVGDGVVSMHGARAEIRRDALGIVEWYENSAQGLEQGWTLSTRPACDSAGRALVLELAAGGGLRAVEDGDGDRIAFVDASGATRLHYGELVALDASGARIPAALSVRDGRVQIRVDDAGARYPLVIDPLITTASWAPESNLAGASFGAAVSTAGDFNGDGYSDVIVGAPSYNLGRGRVYLYLGGPGGPDEVSDASFDGGGAYDYFGTSVAAAGNVNNDAYDDIVVGAPGDFNLSGTNAFGRIAVFLGNASGLLASPQTASNCFNAFPTAREGLGTSVAGAGDVNMDGYDDVVAGGPELSIDLNRSGVVCVYPGSGSGILTGAADVARIPSALWPAADVLQDHSFGVSVSGAGDVNGDGYADIVVGATGARGAANLSVGAAFVFHGPIGDSEAADWVQLGDNRPLFPVTSTALFGGAVADAGDLNGDGYADIIVGAPAYDLSSFGGSNEVGGAFIFHGSAGGIASASPDCDPSNFFTNVPAQYCEFGTAASANMGAIVATAGDLNGDGRADVMFSERVANAQGGFGRADLVYGDPSGTYVISLSFGAPAGGTLASIATAGDPDGDGFSDVVLGVPDYANGQAGEGRALIYRSTGDLPATAVSFSAQMNQAGAALGLGISAGDINGDGYSDIVAGAPNYDGCGLIFDPDVDEGTIQVYYGGSCGPACGPFYFPGFCVYEGNEDGANVGWSVSATGDVNGDGYADVLVGAPGSSAGFFPFPPDVGRAYLYLGSSSGLGSVPATTIYGFEALAELGSSVAIVGDVNGDGRADAVIGEHFSDESTGVDAGSAHLYLGTGSGLSSTSSWDAVGATPFAEFGYAVAGAGDVNRDGYADVIVGAPGTSDGAGAAYVYLGGPTGLASAPAQTILGSFLGAELGRSVATAGDLNGDGYSDVAVGIPGEPSVALYTGPALALFDGAYGNPGSRFGSGVATPGDVNGDGLSDLLVGAQWDDFGAGFAQGSAHLYLGSTAGIPGVPDRSWSDCPHSFCDFGRDVAPAGDVNGDGFGDVVVAAYRRSDGEVDEGGFFVHFGNGVDGLERAPQQLTDAYIPIRPIGNATSASFFRAWAIGRSAAGRTSVRIETETENLATPFDGVGTLLGGYQDSSLTGIMLEGTPQCTTSAPCKWRARVRARPPHFPGSPWLSPPENARTEGDLRLAVDFDMDGANDPADFCATVANSGSDTDMDGVDDACDTCTSTANAPVEGTSVPTNRTLVSRQYDDDADGRGNACDFDYNNAGLTVTTTDFNDAKASQGKSLGASTCGAVPPGGSGNAQRCYEFDHVPGGLTVTVDDFNAAKAAQGKSMSIYPKCTACIAPFSRPLGDPLGSTVGKPVCQASGSGVCPY